MRFGSWPLVSQVCAGSVGRLVSLVKEVPKTSEHRVTPQVQAVAASTTANVDEDANEHSYAPMDRDEDDWAGKLEFGFSEIIF